MEKYCTKLSRGTASGTRVRLKGKGMPSVRNAAQRGDHYITLIVDIPTKLNQEQKDALMAYEKGAYRQ